MPGALGHRRRAGVSRIGLALSWVLGAAWAADAGRLEAAEGWSNGLNGHARPAALALDAHGDLLYVALSTADRLMAIDVTRREPTIAWEIPVCRHPTALAALPESGVVVSCRFDPALRVVTRAGRARAVAAGPEHGQRGVAVDHSGRHAYLASVALGGVKVVPLPGPDDASDALGAPPPSAPPPAPGAASPATPVRFRPTGLGPTVVRVDDFAPTLLLVANGIGHTVTIHRIGADGGLSAAVQTIVTEAPVLDLQTTPDALLLLTYEDRPITRAHRDVEGLDSVVLRLPRVAGGAAPFADAGRGERQTVNLTERRGAPVVALQASAILTRGAETAAIAIAGAGTDNVWVTLPLDADVEGGARVDGVGRAHVIGVGANPSALIFLPDGRLVTADRLSDTLTFVAASAYAVGTPPTSEPEVRQLAVGRLPRSSPAELGELLFFSRELVPNNVADGPLSIYTCAACHVDGHIDGRRHPSKYDRFFSMTKTCRGLAGTAPFLSLGDPATLASFADNIINTHAQGAASSPESFDTYEVRLRLPRADATGSVTWSDKPLAPAASRAALAAYMAGIPIEPSPFVAPGQSRLTPAERRGLRQFRASCSGCHRLARSTGAREPVPEPALERALLAGRVALTSAGRFDVGTPVLGRGGNNPPSLHEVWAAAPYFSDGSATTLEEVLARTDPQAPKVHAPENAARPVFWGQARDDLLAFLRAL